MAGQLFQNAPELQSGQTVMPEGTSGTLTNALMRQPGSFSAPQSTWGQIPLASLAMMMKQGSVQPGAGGYPQTDAATNAALGLAPDAAASPSAQILGQGGVQPSTTTAGLSGQPSLLSDALPNAPGNMSMGNPNGAPWLPGGQSTPPDNTMVQQPTGPMVGAAAPGMPSGVGPPGPAGTLGSLFSGLFGSSPG